MEGSLITVVLTIAMAAVMIGSMLIASWLAPRFLGRGWVEGPADTTLRVRGAPVRTPSNKHRFLRQVLPRSGCCSSSSTSRPLSLIPWAVTFKSFAANRGFVLGEMAVFLCILVAGYLYLLVARRLEWE